MHQPPVRKSIHFITDPKAPVAVPGGPHLYRMFPLFSKGKRRGEQTQLTQLMALWCWKMCSREKLWVRGAPAETRRDISDIHHHPPDTCRDSATCLDTQEQQMHFTVPPA